MSTDDREPRGAAERMRAVALAGARLIEARTLDQLREVVREACARVMCFDFMSLAQYDPAAHTLTFAGRHDEREGYIPPETMHIAGTPSERAIAERRSVVTHRSSEAAGWGARLVGNQQRSESAIRTPVLARDRVLAVVTVQSYTPGLYTPEDVEVLETLAAITAPALLNVEYLADRERAEAALRASEERLRAQIDAIPIATYLWRRRGDELVLEGYNQAALVETEGRVARVRGTSTEWFRAENPEVVRNLETCYEERSAIRSDLRYHRGGGLADRWMIANYTYVAPDTVMVHTQDITERKHAESALRDSEQRLRQVLDALPVGVILTDGAGQITWCNPASEQIWGGSRGVGVEDYDVYRAWHPSGERIASREWAAARALRGEETLGEVVEIETFDGARKTILNSATSLRDSEGRIGGAIWVQQDITEQRALEARRRTLAAALEGLRDGVCLMTPEGEIVFANETFCNLLDFDAALVPGARWNQLIAGDGEAGTCLRAAAGEGRWSGRVRRPRGDGGAELPLDVLLRRVELEGGRPGFLFGMVQDATGQIEKERQLRRAERLAGVGTLIGGVAHELNNPLQAILGFSQLLLLTERSENDREILAMMRRETERVAKIVADLKQIARSTQERVTERAPVDLNDVVRHVLKVQSYGLSTRGVEVVEELAGALPPVLADRGQVEQVVINLVVNAQQAMEASSGPRRLVVGTRATPGGAALCVADSGPGIPAHNVERIFDPFFTTKPPGEGMGLGLSLVHSIVTEHGGELRVESEPGSGATFHVELPLAPEGHTPAAPAPGASPPRPLRLLVVDDEPSVRRVMAIYLSGRGHTVDQASEGLTALNLLEHNSYDVILSDLRMPGLDGEAFLSELRRRGSRAHVIFLTGDVSAAGERLGRAGVPILLKPVRLEEVARLVEESARG